MNTRQDFLLHALLWLTLGGWVGSWVFFAMVVAPIAFTVLPSAAVAGDLIGPALGWLHLYGAAAGLVAAAIALALRRPRWFWVVPLLLTAICLLSHFGVTAAIAEVRPRDFGPDVDAGAAARFAQLHRLSMSLFTLVGLAAIGLLVMHAREDAADASKTAQPGRGGS